MSLSSGKRQNRIRIKKSIRAYLVFFFFLKIVLVEKLNILSDAAKYDVACTSSGSDRQNDGTGIGRIF